MSASKSQIDYIVRTPWGMYVAGLGRYTRDASLACGYGDMQTANYVARNVYEEGYLIRGCLVVKRTVTVEEIVSDGNQQ